MANAPQTISEPLFTNTAHTIYIEVYSDAAFKTPAATTMGDVTMHIQDAGGTLRSYTATAAASGSGASYRGYVTLNAAQHTVAGAADAQVRLGGITKQEFKLTFNTKLA